MYILYKITFQADQYLFWIMVLYNYTEMSKPQRRLVKKTVIPVSVIDNSKEVNGLIHFPTESNPKAIAPNDTQITHKKHSIMFRNQVVRQNQGEQEQTRKRQIELYEIVISPKRSKDKQFKVEVPISKGLKSGKANQKSSEVFFKFSFNNSEGQLVLLNGIQDAKMEIISKGGKGELTAKERLEIQTSMLDNRRKEPISEGRYYQQDED